MENSMTTSATAGRPSRGSPLFLARMAGVFWLLTIVTGSLALVPGLGALPNLISTACYVGATIFIYLVLKPVSSILSLLAAFFGLVGCAIGAYRSFSPPNMTGPNPSFVFFGLQCLLVGYLILRSTFLPRTVGALMAFGGLGWLTLGLSTLLSPSLARSLTPAIMAPGILGEVALTFWLLLKGVNVPRWNEETERAARVL
jgi:uncharacterized protein DUF4386